MRACPPARARSRGSGASASSPRAVPAGFTAAAYAAALTRRPGVAAASPNAAVRRPATVAGACVNQPSNSVLEIPSVSHAVEWWPPPRNTPRIAVLDTGVDPAVPELAGRVLPLIDTIGGQPTGLPDDDGHGTGVAAAAAAAPGRVGGISPTSTILPVRIATANEPATEASIVQGLEAAVKHKAVVAVLAYSAPLISTREPTVTAVETAVSAAFDSGVITVVPSGNDGTNERAFPSELAQVLTVGSAGQFAVRERFSNFGPWLDLVAPGADLTLPAPAAICSTGYAQSSGTSFSAGAVAGAVAWLAAVRPQLGTARLYDLVRRFTATDAGPAGWDADTGFGVLNVGSALSAKKPESNPREVNDDVYWLKRRPRDFPTYLRRTSKVSTSGSLVAGKDPRDAFKVRLEKNDILRVSVQGKDKEDLFSATIWDRRTGSFDMRLGSESRELRNSSGFTRNPLVNYRARRAGTYYAAIFAPDLVLPGEEFLTGDPVPPYMRYTLTLRKRCSSSRRLRVPLARLRRRGVQMTGLRVFVDARPKLRRTRSGLSSRITVNDLRNGRHRIVFKASFGSKARRKSRATNVRTRCSLKLVK